jgi:hypothetical protein
MSLRGVLQRGTTWQSPDPTQHRNPSSGKVATKHVKGGSRTALTLPDIEPETREANAKKALRNGIPERQAEQTLINSETL